jgi:hypothetical protein
VERKTHCRWMTAATPCQGTDPSWQLAPLHHSAPDDPPCLPETPTAIDQCASVAFALLLVPAPVSQQPGLLRPRHPTNHSPCTSDARTGLGSDVSLWGDHRVPGQPSKPNTRARTSSVYWDAGICPFFLFCSILVGGQTKRGVGGGRGQGPSRHASQIRHKDTAAERHATPSRRSR